MNRGKLGPHPRLLEELDASTGLFNRVAKIQIQNADRLPSGSSQHDWIDVQGLESIPCAFSRVTPDMEIRQVEMLANETRGKVMLKGYYPSITPAMRCVLDDGMILNIEDVNIGMVGPSTVLWVRYMPQEAAPGV